MNDGLGYWSAEVNAISKDDWSLSSRAFSDFSIYQCWEYAEVQWGYCRRDHVVIRERGTVVSMAQVVILTLPLIRIAYVPWGPMWKRRDRAEDASLFERTVLALKDEYVGRRKMTLRIRPYGFEGRDEALERAMQAAGFAQTREARRSRPRTILVDLERPETELRKRLGKSWRNSLGRSEKLGLTIRESFDKQGLLQLRPLYDDLKTTKGFEGLDLEALALIQSRLPRPQQMRVTLCEDETGVIAGSVCSGIGDTALGILGVTSAEGRKKRAYYLLQWDEILWAKRNANKAYDVNVINPATNPQVYHFKSGLRGEELDFLGTFDCFPGRLAGWFTRFTDVALQRVSKGRVIKLLKRIRTVGQKPRAEDAPGPGVQPYPRA